MEIREVQLSDAEALVALNRLLSRETDFMLRVPDEVSESEEDQRQVLQRISESSDEHFLVADSGANLVGFVVAYRKPLKRVRHTFNLVIGIRKSHWGQGIGRRLISEIEESVRRAGATRLELTVMDENRRAVRLYKNCGYAVEGRRSQSILVDDKLADELYMAKIL